MGRSVQNKDLVAAALLVLSSQSGKPVAAKQGGKAGPQKPASQITVATRAQISKDMFNDSAEEQKMTEVALKSQTTAAVASNISGFAQKKIVNELSEASKHAKLAAYATYRTYSAQGIELGMTEEEAHAHAVKQVKKLAAIANKVLDTVMQDAIRDRGVMKKAGTGKPSVLAAPSCVVTEV